MKKKDENKVRVMRTKGGMMKEKAVLVDIDGTLVSVTPNWSAERDLEWVEDTLICVGV